VLAGRSFVILLQQERPDQVRDGGFMGKMPTTSVQRLISPFSRSMVLWECNFEQCVAGKFMHASTSGSVAFMNAASFGHFGCN
jgi:hypothetical protein